MKIMTVLKTSGVAVAAAWSQAQPQRKPRPGNGTCPSWVASATPGLTRSKVRVLKRVLLSIPDRKRRLFHSDAWEVKANISVFGFNGAIGDEGEEGEPNDVNGLVVPLTAGADYHSTRKANSSIRGCSPGRLGCGSRLRRELASSGRLVGDVHAASSNLSARMWPSITDSAIRWSSSPARP